MSLYTLDYNQLANKQPISWQMNSRNNLYKFNVTSDTVIDATDIIKHVNATSVLDYGCGYGHALDSISNIVSIKKYDPFVSEFITRPTGKYDLVVAYNVLNVVETDCFDDVMEDLYQLTRKILLLNISCDGFYNRKKNWYLDKFESNNKFKLSASNYTEIRLTNTITNRITNEVISFKTLDKNYLFAILKIV